MAELVPRYVERALATGSPERVRITQVGQMWMKPGGRALRFTAEEDLEVQRVGFSWRARFALGLLRVTDGYEDGEGRLEVRLAGLPLQRKRGPEFNEGELIRYLAELPWVPHAMVQNPELEWRELEDRAVEAATGGLAVRLDFDEHGDVTRARSEQRRYEGAPTPWGGEYSDYAVVGGLRIPTAAEVWWDLPAGRFVYWRGRVLTAQA